MERILIIVWAVIVFISVTAFSFLFLSEAASGGELLVRHNGALHLGDVLIGMSADDCSRDPAKCSALLEFKVPPSTGMIRIIGSKNVFLASKQFEYKTEPHGLFGWSEKKVYQDFLPVLLPMPDNNSIAIYKAVVVSTLGGIQVATIYLYRRENYTLPINIHCSGKTSIATGAAICKQFKDSSFGVSIAQEAGVAECNKEPVLYIPTSAPDIQAAPIKINVSGCQTTIKTRSGQKAIVFDAVQPDEVELPNVVPVDNAIRIGLETELAQCGKKRFFKDRLETQLVDCASEGIVYQWAKDGRFRFEFLRQ